MKKFKSKYGYFTRGRPRIRDHPPPIRRARGSTSFVTANTASLKLKRDLEFRGTATPTFRALTRWDQDLIRDSWGKHIYVQDRENGRVWSATWKPCCPDFDFYEVRHGQGYSILRSEYQKIAIEKTGFHRF